MSSAGDKYSEIMEQIHEIFSAIIMLYETQIDGILPPEFLSEIAKFAEYVQLEFKAVWHVNDTSEILAPDTCVLESQRRDGKTQTVPEYIGKRSTTGLTQNGDITGGQVRYFGHDEN
jgi:hypothetical protein